jgi:16S rRNA A1518/A1519 N6-dimethyltransferase RsmA/KsgA/DIM1 with predicted DNA glycosylase/AP lyase activity
MEVDKVGKGGKLNQHFTPDAGADIIGRKIVELFGDKPVTVLDACAGSGQLLNSAIKHGNVVAATAVELDAHYVEMLKRRFGSS